MKSFPAIFNQSKSTFVELIEMVTRSAKKKEIEISNEKENIGTPMTKRPVPEVTIVEETPKNKPKKDPAETPLRTPKTPNQLKPTPMKRTPKMSPREENIWKKKAEEEIARLNEMFEEVDKEKIKIQKVSPFL
jgi:hypothetical protein